MSLLVFRRNGARAFKVAGRSHGLPEHVVMASLGEQLDEHVGADWYAWVVFDDGGGIALGQNTQTPEPPAPIWNLLRSTAGLLNAQMAFDGHWIVAYSTTDKEPRLLWRDWAGDAHCCVEIPARGMGLLTWSEVDMMHLADEAVRVARERLGRLDLAKSQTFHEALGEAPTTTH